MTCGSTADFPAQAALRALPKILYGTAWKKQRTADLVASALKHGFRGIDTACQPRHYREDLVGIGIIKAYHENPDLRREDLFLQTKFSPISAQDPSNIPYDPLSSIATQVSSSVQTSLKNLQTMYIDSLVLHSPYSDPQDTISAWRAMEEEVSKGHVRSLGISNEYSLKNLRWLYSHARVKPSVVQNRFYHQSGYDKEIRSFCQENGVVYQSFWTLTANPHLLQSTELKDLAQKRGITVEQALYRFVLDLGITPLDGTTSEKHMDEDLVVARSVTPLSEFELQEINQLLQ
eukprot:CAMPEP_0201491764 /NCGR_PEP_ID=MMETSP0151_2-20130828/31114_1 /ASSEMBLY_ACC=CAM_ASM_000257 /TAXON_ID=200890 /ORGANISM="Paramoeba atlantica, Strain 621/1 / CCAP 1560/9" /LENGTH=289 /DNA_ID=CAMNT_0047878279 /DNA_START=60 /DNA_END=929 /DNA_ORIENTATION=+